MRLLEATLFTASLWFYAAAPFYLPRGARWAVPLAMIWYSAPIFALAIWSLYA